MSASAPKACKWENWLSVQLRPIRRFRSCCRNGCKRLGISIAHRVWRLMITRGTSFTWHTIADKVPEQVGLAADVGTLEIQVFVADPLVSTLHWQNCRPSRSLAHTFSVLPVPIRWINCTPNHLRQWRTCGWRYRLVGVAFSGTVVLSTDFVFLVVDSVVVDFAVAAGLEAAVVGSMDSTAVSLGKRTVIDNAGLYTSARAPDRGTTTATKRKAPVKIVLHTTSWR